MPEHAGKAMLHDRSLLKRRSTACVCVPLTMAACLGALHSCDQSQACMTWVTVRVCLRAVATTSRLSKVGFPFRMEARALTALALMVGPCACGGFQALSRSSRELAGKIAAKLC